VIGGRPLDLEVRHLRLVTAVADTGNLTRAADRLNLTQSALSHQLRDIEERLKTPLFHRVGKKMILTQSGARILESARRILLDLEQAEEDLRLLAHDRAGVLRLTTQCYTCYHWLPQLMRDFGERYPKVELIIEADATSRPLDAVLDASVDVAIMSDEIDDSRVVVTPLFEDEMLMIVAPEHPLAQRDFARAQDFASEMLLTYATLEESQIYRRVLRPAGVQPLRHAQVRLTEAMIELVRAQMGVAVLAHWAVAPLLKAGTVKGVPVTARGLTRVWKGVTLKTERTPIWMSDFLKLIAREGTRGASPARVSA
jgi:LysR family transcriptional regulator for metE and metH